MELQLGTDLETKKGETTVIVTVRGYINIKMYQNGNLAVVHIGYVCNYKDKIEEFFWETKQLHSLIKNGTVIIKTAQNNV